MRKKLQLLSLPSVVHDHILLFLTIPEQLNLRAVCKTTKHWVDRNTSKLAEHIPSSLVPYHGEHSFNMLFSRRIPHLISNLHLESETLAVYNDNVLFEHFVPLYGSSVEKLHVTRYFICSNNGKQTEFFESFENLKSLEVDEIWVANADDITTRIPEKFRHLTNLKLGHVKVYNEATYEVYESIVMPLERKKSIRWHVWNVLDICDRLEYLRVPISPKFLFDNTFDECFRLLNYIRIRTRGITERGFRAQRSQAAVMRCDINNFACCTSSLEVLLIVGARMRIQFHNVNSKVFRRGSSFCVIGIPPRARFDYIFSFVSTSLVNRQFDYLQKVTFRASSIQNECIIGREKGPELFPNLKEFALILDIGFDTQSPTAVYSRLVNPQPDPNNPLLQHRNVCFPRADQVLRFFFPPDSIYQNVHTCSITFTDPTFQEQKRASPDRMVSLTNVIRGLPSLRRLSIGGWNCKRDTYFKLWHGFPNLERLVIDQCTTLTASCFIDGNGNPSNPANFQFLKRLDLLELRGLDDMPGMTGRSGSSMEVFARMGLVEFKLLGKRQTPPRTSVWMRPVPGCGLSSVSPSPSTLSSWSYNHSTIITRSITKAMKNAQ